MSESTARTVDTVPAPARRTSLVKVLAAIGMMGGLVLIVGGIVVWTIVSSQLRAENITVPDDAMAFQGQTVQGPFTAFVQADIIQHHALDASGGKTYAELAQDDPVRATMMNASFLRASLFTSVVSFGVSAFAIGTGILSLVFGLAVWRVGSAPVVVRPSRVVASR